jgi:hypothetical protein
MGLRPTQGNEKRLGPASTLYGTVTLSLSSRPERSGVEGPAVSFLGSHPPSLAPVLFKRSRVKREAWKDVTRRQDFQPQTRSRRDNLAPQPNAW